MSLPSPTSLRATNFDTNQIAIDAGALGKLKRTAGKDPQTALRATAQQFETLFMNMLMKSMRDTLPKEGLLSSSANDMYTGMLDQQLAQKMSARGTGIADMIVKQLSKQMVGADGAKPIAEANKQPARSMGAERSNGHLSPAVTAAASAAADAVHSRSRAARANPAVENDNRAGNVGLGAGAGLNIRFQDQQALVARLQGPPGSDTAPVGSVPMLAAGGGTSTAITRTTDTPRTFVKNMQAHAQDAERQTGVPAKFMLGQAALESGWGKKEITHADGSPAHNLFGIKAGGSWQGKTVSVTTTEFIGGVARKMVEKFRAYSSYAESFADYAKLIGGNPRYQNVLKQGGNVEGFANAMQRAGYATDPRYAEKLSKTINHMIALK